jgi:hypothetical protein
MMTATVSRIVLQSETAWPGVEGSIPLLCVIFAAVLGTGALFVVSLLAYRQRRSLRYLLVTIAVGALLFRSVVGIGTVSGVVPMPVHHFLEHSLDFLIAALILFAALRSTPSRLDTDHDETA